MASRSFLVGVIRASAQAARQAQAAQRHASLQTERIARVRVASIRAAEAEERRAFAQAERERKTAERESKERYLQARLNEGDRKAAEAETLLSEIGGVLLHTLQVDDRIQFWSLLLDERFPPLRAPAQLIKPTSVADLAVRLKRIRPRSLFEKLFGLNRRWDRETQQVTAAHELAKAAYEVELAKYNALLLVAHQNYEEEKKGFEAICMSGYGTWAYWLACVRPPACRRSGAHVRARMEGPRS